LWCMSFLFFVMHACMLENVEFKRKIEAEVVELNYKCQASPKTFKALREALGKWTK
jgi:hypothetical protein